ncbi:hypothetical protein [Rhodococcus sp. OK302]|nr:hypothetical protein [Rhodococcus sp. OK302]
MSTIQPLWRSAAEAEKTAAAQTGAKYVDTQSKGLAPELADAILLD